jgi:hypothetical protein
MSSFRGLYAAHEVYHIFPASGYAQIFFDLHHQTSFNLKLPVVNVIDEYLTFSALPYSWLG